MSPFFSSTLSTIPLYIFFLHFKIFTIQFSHAKEDAFKPDNISTLFHIKFANFWCITCFVTNLIPMWPESHGLECRIKTIKVASVFLVGHMNRLKWELLFN